MSGSSHASCGKFLPTGDTELGAPGTDISQTFLWPQEFGPEGGPSLRSLIELTKQEHPTVAIRPQGVHQPTPFLVYNLLESFFLHLCSTGE